MNIAVECDVRCVGEPCFDGALAGGLHDESLPIETQHCTLGLHVHGQLVVAGGEEASHVAFDPDRQAPWVVSNVHRWIVF